MENRPAEAIAMNLSATLILAFGMSMDAFAASIGKGAVLHKPRFRDAIRTGLIFGLVEAITPLSVGRWVSSPANTSLSGIIGWLSRCWSSWVGA